MWKEVFDLAIKNGLWAVLFLGLLIFVLKDSKQRENKYQKTIKDLTEHLGVVHEIKEEVQEIKDIVFKKSKVNKKSTTNEKTIVEVKDEKQI